jgi:hypothetical protein
VQPSDFARIARRAEALGLRDLLDPRERTRRGAR